MKSARVLLYDIETSPNLGYVWGKWEQNVIEFKQQWEILSVAYKWLGDKEVKCIARPHFKDKTEKSLVVALWKLFDEADVIVGHNSDAFDNRKSKAKFVEHGLKPPSTYKTVDTKKVAKSQFNFNSNSLNDLGQTLNLGKKLNTGGFQLWLDCISGDKKAWNTMIRYNKQDVVLLERVYLKLRAWYPSHPNLELFKEKLYTNEICPICSSSHTHRQGFSICQKTKRQRYHCQECGHWYTGKIEKPLKSSK